MRKNFVKEDEGNNKNYGNYFYWFTNDSTWIKDDDTRRVVSK
jgi:hypothetical protein